LASNVIRIVPLPEIRSLRSLVALVLSIFNSKIVQELRERDELDLIKGFIDVDRKTGEFIRYDMEGSVWKSEGKSVTNPPIVNP
jgi:hypothetical protein